MAHAVLLDFADCPLRRVITRNNISDSDMASRCFAESVRPKLLPFNPAQPLERAPRQNRPRELPAQVRERR